MRAQPPALGLDHGGVRPVDFRNQHGHVGRMAVGAVVADDGHLGLGIAFLEGADLFLFHIHGAEHKIDLPGYAFHVGGVQHRQPADGRGNRRAGKGPAARHRLGVRLSGTAAGSHHARDLEPGMLLQKQREPLPNHARCADDADPIFLHDETPLPCSVIHKNRFPKRCAPYQHMPPDAPGDAGKDT